MYWRNCKLENPNPRYIKHKYHEARLRRAPHSLRRWDSRLPARHWGASFQTLDWSYLKLTLIACYAKGWYDRNGLGIILAPPLQFITYVILRKSIITHYYEMYVLSMYTFVQIYILSFSLPFDIVETGKYLPMIKRKNERYMLKFSLLELYWGLSRK